MWEGPSFRLGAPDHMLRLVCSPARSLASSWVLREIEQRNLSELICQGVDEESKV
jgi:hypothetical protein